MASKTSTTQPQPEAEAKPKAKKSKRADESTILSRYPHALPGTLRFEDEGKHAGKQTVLIACSESGCKAQRRVATSDLFQIRFCEEHAKASRKAAQAEKREIAKAAKAAVKAATAEATPAAAKPQAESGPIVRPKVTIRKTA